MDDNSLPTPAGRSARFAEMASRTERYGLLQDADGYGQASSPCGDMIEFSLRLRGELLQLVTFQVRGCSAMVACGNAVSTLAEGATFDLAWQVGAADIDRLLDSLDPAQYHCAELATAAFLQALADCRRLKREPWKKPYRRHPS